MMSSNLLCKRLLTAANLGCCALADTENVLLLIGAETLAENLPMLLVYLVREIFRGIALLVGCNCPRSYSRRASSIAPRVLG